MNAPSLSPELLVLLIPLGLLQVGLLVLAVVDLLRDERRVRGGNKGVWAVVIVFVSMVGPLLYFLFGREEGVPDEPAPGPGAMPGWGSPHDPSIIAGDTPTAPAPVPGRAGGATAAAPVALSAAEPPRRSPVLDAAPSIQVRELSKRYPGPGGGVLALDRLSMDVPTGSVFGLLGPNGAGKTTCLRLLAGLTRPTSGRAELAGHALPEQAMAARRELGYLEQDPRAYGWLTGREQVAMLGELHGLTGPELARAVTTALTRVDLLTAADRRVASYSGGMRQRLGIAGALVHDPRVVVLDEPVSALDPAGRRDVLDLIADLRGDRTVLFSTHVLADVERICDRVAILAHGRLVVEGPLAELLERYALPVYRIEGEPGQGAALDALAATLRSLPWVTGAVVEHGLLSVIVAEPDVAARELLQVIATSGVAIISVARARPTLEDVFLRLTGDSREAAA